MAAETVLEIIAGCGNDISEEHYPVGSLTLYI